MLHNTIINDSPYLSGQNVKDIHKDNMINTGYHPKEKQRKLSQAATRNFALYFAALSDKIYHEHRKRKAALVQSFMSARMYPRPQTIGQVAKILVKCVINYRRSF